MAFFDFAQIPGDHQISDGLDEGELLEHLRNAPITSLPPSPTNMFPQHDHFPSSRNCASLRITGDLYMGRRKFSVIANIYLKSMFIDIPYDTLNVLLNFEWILRTGGHEERIFDIFFDMLDKENVITQQLKWCSLDVERFVESMNLFMESMNLFMDKKLDSRLIDSAELELQIVTVYDVTKSGYKAGIGDMSCDAMCHSHMKNSMETPERKCGTKREITIEDLQPLFGQKFEDASKILGVSVSAFKRSCRRNGITRWNVSECSRSVELGPKHRKTKKTTPSCKTPSITGLAEMGNQELDISIVEIEGNLQEQNSFQTENVLKEQFVMLMSLWLNEKFDKSMLRDLSEEKLFVGFEVTKNGYKAGIGDMSCDAVCHSHMKNSMETPERKCGTKREITIEDLQPLFGKKRENAAKILGVSVSTFKRHCRRNGIKWWNGGECSRFLELDPKHRETPGERTTPSCKTPSITGWAETGNQVLDSSIVNIEGNLQEQNSFQTENVLKEVEADVSEGDSKSSCPMLSCSDLAPKQSVVTIKATYGEDTVKFDLSSTPGIVELKEEVAKRLELESDSFKVKYQDEDQEWILIACDADFQQCLKFSSSLGNPIIKLLVVDKVSNFGKSSKRCRRR